MRHGGTWAIVPVNAFHRAKSRLAGVLDPAARMALARAGCVHVLGVLRACSEIAGVIVLTPDEEVAECARRLGAEVIADAASERRLSWLVDPALDSLATRGATAALVLMSDLPTLQVADVAAMLDALRDAEVALAPDRHERGTNALGLRPPSVMRTCFGHEDSLVRHIAAADARGLRMAMVRSPSLGLDVDRLEDLRLLRDGIDAAVSG